MYLLERTERRKGDKVGRVFCFLKEILVRRF